jgi:hypothetical protein
MERCHVTRRALLVGAALGGLERGARAGTPSSPPPLFVIARSKNANVVRYDARLVRPGHLDPAQPIRAYWIMHAEDGRREELTFMERKLAYGWSVSFDSEGELKLRLKAFEQRDIRVASDENGGFHAVTRIARRHAVLERIYVASDEHALLPSVRYVDVVGTALPGGQRLSERIVP